MDLIAILTQIANVAKDYVGIVMPFFIDLINRKITNSNWKFVVSLVLCLVVAVVVNLNQLLGGDITVVIGKIGLVFTEAQIIYKLYWMNSQARTKLIGNGK